jgi:hypothetical protein
MANVLSSVKIIMLWNARSAILVDYAAFVCKASRRTLTKNIAQRNGKQLSVSVQNQKAKRGILQIVSIELNGENAMDSTTQPSKERIRDWIYNRQLEPKPLPDMDRIRIEIGWDVEPAKRDRMHHSQSHNRKG